MPTAPIVNWSLSEVEIMILDIMRKYGKVWESQWFNPQATVDALESLCKKGLLRYDKATSYNPERYVLVSPIPARKEDAASVPAHLVHGPMYGLFETQLFPQELVLTVLVGLCE